MSSNQVYVMICVPVEGTVSDFERSVIFDNISNAVKDAHEDGSLLVGMTKAVADHLDFRMGTPTATLQPYETVSVYTTDNRKHRQVKVSMIPGGDGFYQFEVYINNDFWGLRPTRIPNGRGYEVVSQRALHVRDCVEEASNQSDIFTVLERLQRNLLG